MYSLRQIKFSCVPYTYTLKLFERFSLDSSETLITRSFELIFHSKLQVDFSIVTSKNHSNRAPVATTRQRALAIKIIKKCKNHKILYLTSLSIKY